MSIFSKEYLDNKYEERKAYLLRVAPGSDTPKPLFIDGKFNPKNWNSGQDVFRVLYQTVDNPGFFIKTVDEDHYIMAFFKCVYEEWYVVIDIYEITEDERIITYSLRIKWYKQRGRTDEILYNNQPIAEHEYIKVIQYLDDCGFFDADRWNKIN